MLGGGGARGAAQVGVLQALFEAGVDPPTAVVGTSVGALNGSAIAAYPSLAGTMMLREVWMSRQAIDVFRAHPLGMILSGLKRDQMSAFPQQNIRRLVERAQSLTGITTFEQLRDQARIVVLCPVTSPTATWEMKREHLDKVMESAREATAALLSRRGSKLFRHSGIHYLELQ